MFESDSKVVKITFVIFKELFGHMLLIFKINFDDTKITSRSVKLSVKLICMIKDEFWSDFEHEKSDSNHFKITPKHKLKWNKGQ